MFQHITREDVAEKKNINWIIDTVKWKKLKHLFSLNMFMGTKCKIKLKTSSPKEDKLARNSTLSFQYVIIFANTKENWQIHVK